MMRNSVILVYAIFTVAWMTAGEVRAQTLYQIGNSLTWDTQPLITEETATAAGIALDIGFHIKSSSSPFNIWNNPTITDNYSPQYGQFTEALPNHDWDGITVQPHFDWGNTLGEDVSAIHSFVNLAQSQGRNADTTLYVYAAWPRQSGKQSWEHWAWTGIEDDPSQQMYYRELYFDTLMGNLQGTYGEQVKLIPAGHVLSEVRDQIAQGKLPQLSSIGSVYRDALHLNTIGRFIASTTVFSTVTGQSPVGLPVPAEWENDNTLAELAEPLQQLVWEVVTRNPLTGILGKPSGDFDGDGDVDNDDYLIWYSDAQQPTLLADSNNDKTVDELDLVFWAERVFPAGAEALADYDQSGVLNLDDYQLWKDEFGTTGSSPADGNNDGVVDAADYVIWQDGFKNISNRMRADFNGDGVVDDGDFAVWEAENGTVLSLQADANNDGFVDSADYTYWLDYYTGPLASAATLASVPEPVGIGLALMALLGLMGRRRV